jgi:hypothetical protein
VALGGNQAINLAAADIFIFNTTDELNSDELRSGAAVAAAETANTVGLTSVTVGRGAVFLIGNESVDGDGKCIISAPETRRRRSIRATPCSSGLHQRRRIGHPDDQHRDHLGRPAAVAGKR